MGRIVHPSKDFWAHHQPQATTPEDQRKKRLRSLYAQLAELELHRDQILNEIRHLAPAIIAGVVAISLIALPAIGVALVHSRRRTQPIMVVHSSPQSSPSPTPGSGPIPGVAIPRSPIASPQPKPSSTPVKAPVPVATPAPVPVATPAPIAPPVVPTVAPPTLPPILPSLPPILPIRLPLGG